MIRLARAAAWALLALAAAAPLAQAATPDPFLGEPFEQDQLLAYQWGTGGAPPVGIRDAIKAAVADANESHFSKAPTFDRVSSSASSITYGGSVPCGENGLACFRRNPPDWFRVYLRENGHRFDWGTLRWCEATGRPDGCFDAENITLDELGHVLGLDHHVNLPDESDYGDAVVQTYSRAKPEPYYRAHKFGRCDVATLQQVYDVKDSWTLYSTCLDVPTTLILSAPTTVPAGASVTFTASLWSDGSGRLGNNKVSGRTVVLQRSSATGWDDVATMTPAATTGSYVAAVTVGTSTSWRARFRAPSHEGLRGSASDPVGVTVSFTCTESRCPLVGTGAQ